MSLPPPSCAISATVPKWVQSGFRHFFLETFNNKPNRHPVHRHFTLAKREDIYHLLSMAPVRDIQEYTDQYFDDAEYARLTAHNWFRARIEPSGASELIERHCSPTRDKESLILATVKDDQERLEERMEKLSVLAEYEFTRYSLDTTKLGVGITLYIDVVSLPKKSTPEYAVIGTIRFQVNAALNRALEALPKILVRPIPGRIYHVLTSDANTPQPILECLEEVALGYRNEAGKLLALHDDPLGHHKARAANQHR